ncbi:tetratricopeptide repeat protein [Agaribacter marinus]|uniref:MSHA biogenesis protein MshN n=1 Tax=Agaribacter marinus TaxID=1431249 RepID=A0AA37T6D7_9ALTE|nr:tetratricopeptide repeat protein [Agaribacter marinus]GLR72235.1 MSHA biogenesis protein MshN [Agaribacter marinus]
MSVVNKMLKDLEGRQQAQHVSADYVPPNTGRTKQLLLSVVIVGLAASTLTLGIQQFTANSHEPNQPEFKADEPAYEPKQGDLLASEASSDAETQEKIKLVTSDEVDTGQNTRQTTNHTGHQIVAEHTSSLSEEEIPSNTTPDTSLENTLEIKASSGISHRVSEMRARAHMALENRQSQKAISILASLTSLDKKDVQARKQLASLLFAENQIAQAFNTLQVGLTDFPEDSSMRLMQARIAFKQGDKRLAMNILRAHPDKSIASADFMSFRAALAEKNGEYKQAYSDYSILVNREPQNAKWWLGLAVSQDKLLMQDEAVSSYMQVRELNQLPHQVHSFVEERLQLLTRRS